MNADENSFLKKLKKGRQNILKILDCAAIFVVQ